MRAKLVGAALVGGLLLAQHLFADEASRHSLPDDPTEAWQEVQKLHATLRAPDEWRTRKPTEDEVSQFQQQVRQNAISFADKLREFIDRFPKNENVGDARVYIVYVLSHAVAAGDAEAEKQIEAFVSSVLSDKAIPEDNRVGVLLFAGNAAFMKKIGMRHFTEDRTPELSEELEEAGIESMQSALKEFPGNSFIYTMLVGVAQRSTGERQTTLANQVLDTPDAPAGAKTLARHILNGTKPYQIGKPLDIQFTALDGRDVDLAKLVGKVVLVEFWSTECGPCIGEMPKVKAAYEKLHDRGFEVVAISLDDKENTLRRFLKENELPWPQHFDGKGWSNHFASQYGIFSIPTMWLVDKQGNLRDTEARGDLEHSVGELLDEDIDAN